MMSGMKLFGVYIAREWPLERYEEKFGILVAHSAENRSTARILRRCF